MPSPSANLEPAAQDCRGPASILQSARPVIGLVAGWGRYPLVVADALRQQGYVVYGLGIKEHTDAALVPLCDEFTWVGLTRMGQAMRYFRRNGVRVMTWAGKIHKVRLYTPLAYLKYFPDWQTFRTFGPHFFSRRKDRRDDALLGAVVEAFAAIGIQTLPATDFVPEVLVKFGQLTRRGPSAAQRVDIQFGWRLAKELGRLDIGQSVAVKDRTPLAVEAIEGTDECIRRAGALCTAGGFSVVKVAKPQQDMRFDVPTIGLGTFEAMAAAGGKLLAVEAGRTIFVDQPQCLQFAERHGIVVVALEHQGDCPPELPVRSG
jgi:UDP-2,3-diacylglucosamine hydrolase